MIRAINNSYNEVKMFYLKGKELVSMFLFECFIVALALWVILGRWLDVNDDKQ